MPRIFFAMMLAVWTGTGCAGCDDGPAGTSGGDDVGALVDDAAQTGGDAMQTNIPTASDGDGDGILDASEVILGTNPSTPDEACARDVYTARVENKPVDIIFIIDNSSSMGREIGSVEANVNQNFADIIRDSGVDFRVIMISSHAAPEDHHICVSEPLSGTNCEPPPATPVNSENFFHYDVGVDSNDSFSLLLETYNQPDMHGFAPNGWSQWLREDAFKVFIEITDDDSEDALPSGAPPRANNFDATLLTLEPPHFGRPGFRNYIFHSIVGLSENTPGSDPWLPADPIVDSQCSTASGPGKDYQRLSVVTGGLRYPVCRTESYDVVFRAAATGIIDQARLNCTLRLPDAPAGQFVDLDAMVLQFEDAPGAEPRAITRARSQAECGADQFYISGSSIQLCPTLCDEVKASETGELTALAACSETTEECVPTGELEMVCDDRIDNDCDGFVDRADVECLL